MSEAKLTFGQGLQLFFIQRILEEHTMGTFFGNKNLDQFFRQWSQIVCEGRKKDKDFPCSIKVPEDLGKKMPEEGREIEGSLDTEVKRVGKEIQKVAGAIKLATVAGKYGEEYRPMLENPRFSDLLGDEDLGQLMRIPYPTEAQAAEIAAVVGTSKDEDIIREAIARQLKKKPDELTEDDYSNIKELDLVGSGISDLEPIKGLRSLKTLVLSNTQVSNLEPIKGLSSLKLLYLNFTQVSKIEPIKGLSSLQGLDLSETAVSDIKPIKRLSNLEWLRLTNTQVRNLEPIKGFSNLQRLDLRDTQVADEQVVELQKALPKLNIRR